MRLPVYAPMLATRSPQVTGGPGWVHEVKWDGVRAIVSGDGSMRSRNGNRIDGGYPELVGLVPPDCVVDGEIVAFDSAGKPSFQLLQSRMHVRAPGADLVAAAPITLMLFDLLFQGQPLVEAVWEARRARLEALEIHPPAVLVDVHDDGPSLFAAVQEHELEGIVSKRLGSKYRPGRRSDDWRKTAHRQTCEAVVIGAVGGTGSRTTTFGSLALGMWTGDGRLRYVGAVGSGFDHSTLQAVHAALGDLATLGPPPMEDASLVPSPVRWVEPELVAVVEYAAWTADHRLRAPVFKGFSATPAGEITWDREGAP